jgi:AAT family amino acid transporter
MAMLAVGGSIGTGLLLGAGEAIHIAGPAVIVSYVLAGIIMWTVAVALGEMATLHPSAGSFGTYAELYLNPWAGFVSRYGYWLAMVLSIGAELIASATYMKLWLPALPPVFWVAVFGAGLLAVNLFSVGDYAEAEYWFAMIKVVVILAFIILGASFLFSGRTPAQYTANGGFFPNGPVSPLLAMSFAIFTFGGVEMVAISSGEARSGAEVPRATRIMFTMLAVIYIGATAVLVGIMDWKQAGVAESPFVTVLRLAGVPAAQHVMNFVVLTAALSGANASLYSASRTIFSLAEQGYSPAALARLTGHGSPRNALVVSSLGIFAAVALILLLPGRAFLYLLGAALFGGVIAWLVVLAAHVSFRRQSTPEQLASLPLRLPGGALASSVGFIGMCIAIAVTWSTSLRITIVSGPVLLAILSFGYWLNRRSRRPLSAA